jgi:hypothetical protein
VFQLRVDSPELLRGQADGDAPGREVDGPNQLSAVLDPLLAGQRGFVTGPIVARNRVVLLARIGELEAAL